MSNPRPPIRIRRNARARHIRLRLTAGELLLTVPSSLSDRTVKSWLRDQDAWIDQHWQQFSAKQKPLELPSGLILAALGQQLAVTFKSEEERQKLRLEETVGGLVIKSGPGHTQQDCLGVVRQWLVAQAKIHLPQRVAEHCSRIGVKVSGVQVRDQRTRWGSCSSAGKINLNYRLLLLPPEMMDYVICHELAHLDHLNHSPSFWHRLETILPGAQQLDRRLRLQARQHLPAWLEAL